MRLSAWSLILLLGLASSAFSGWVKDTQEDSLPSMATIESTHTRITISDGEAAIINGDEASAREKAKNQAIRAAIEKVIGVYVEATSRGEDYQEVKDEILTHSSGYAYVLDIISEHVEDGIMHVKAKIEVSLDPITDRLAKAGLTRRWRIMVVVPETHLRRPRIPDPAAETAIVSELLKNKYRLMDQSLASKIRYDDDIAAASHGDTEAIKRVFSRSKADILVTGEAISQWAENLNNMVSCRARVELKAIRRDTGEIISSIGEQQGGVDITEEMAAKTALERAGREASKQLLYDLAVLPASADLNVQMVVTDCEGISTLSSIENKLREVSGIRSVQRDEFEDGIGYLELTVDSASINDIQSKVEQIKSPELQVVKASKNYIEARVRR